MSASERKFLVHLVLLYLVVATVHAKALTKREAPSTNYFENMLNRLDKVKSVPIIGDALKPYLTRIYTTVERIDKWSDGSLSRLVNSIFPCELNGTVLLCTGTLDRDSLHTFIKKVIKILPVSDSVLPLLQLAADMLI